MRIIHINSDIMGGAKQTRYSVAETVEMHDNAVHRYRRLLKVFESHKKAENWPQAGTVAQELRDVAWQAARSSAIGVTTLTLTNDVGAWQGLIVVATFGLIATRDDGDKMHTHTMSRLANHRIEKAERAIALVKSKR
jgi:hypothetical protein